MIFVMLIIFHFSFNNLHILIGIYYMYLLKFLVLAFSNWHFSVLLYHYYIIGTYIPLIGFILQSAKKRRQPRLLELINKPVGGVWPGP